MSHDEVRHCPKEITVETNKEIAALLAERVGYVRRNLPHKVRGVDEALTALGYVVPETATQAPGQERAVAPKARKRNK